MKIDIIKIGNSQGIRIPKPVIETLGLEGEVELEIAGGKLVLSPVKKLRDGWEESFRQMAGDGDDEMLLPDHVSPALEETDWEW